MPITTQVGFFFELTSAADVTAPRWPLPTTGPADLKMGFHGCGVVNGIAGVIWAFGLSSQCDTVAARVRSVLETWPDVALIINVCGLSRGGIAALGLAQRLSSLEAVAQARVTLNLCLYDPVPGNLVYTAKFLDPFWTSTANEVLDVSECTIARVLALYPHEPLPDLAFHAPLLPVYPPTCEVNEDATLGCHQGALYPPAVMMRHDPSLVGECLLSFERVHSFLVRCGTKLHAVPPVALGGLEVATMEAASPPGSAPGAAPSSVPRSPHSAAPALEDECLNIMERALAEARPTRRVAHHRHHSGLVIRHRAARFLNRHHLELVARLAASRPSSSVHAERLALGLKGLNVMSRSTGTGGAAADRAESPLPRDFLPTEEALLGAQAFPDGGLPLFLLQVLRSGAEESRNRAASPLVAKTILDAMRLPTPPPCVPCFPTTVRMRRLPTSLQLLCGIYSIDLDLRNGRPSWTLRTHANGAGGLLPSLYWVPERQVWAIWTGGVQGGGPQGVGLQGISESAAAAQATVSIHVESLHAHLTPVGPWSQNASVVAEYASS